MSDRIDRFRELVQRLKPDYLKMANERIDTAQSDWQEKVRADSHRFRESAKSELRMACSIVLELANPVSPSKIREVRNILTQASGLVDYIPSPPLWALKSEQNEGVVLDGAVTYLVAIGDDESRDGLLSSGTLFQIIDGRSDAFRSSLTAVWDELERHGLLAKHWSVLRKQLT